MAIVLQITCQNFRTKFDKLGDFSTEPFAIYTVVCILYNIAMSKNAQTHRDSSRRIRYVRRRFILWQHAVYNSTFELKSMSLLYHMKETLNLSIIIYCVILTGTNLYNTRTTNVQIITASDLLPMHHTFNHTSITNQKAPQGRTARYSTPTHKYNWTKLLVLGTYQRPPPPDPCDCTSFTAFTEIARF